MSLLEFLHNTNLFILSIFAKLNYSNHNQSTCSIYVQCLLYFRWGKYSSTTNQTCIKTMKQKFSFWGNRFLWKIFYTKKTFYVETKRSLKQILVEKEKKSAVETGRSSWRSCSDDRRRRNKVCLFPLLFHQWTKSAETTVSTFFPPDLGSIPRPHCVNTGSSSKTGNPCKIDKDIKQHRESEMFNE